MQAASPVDGNVSLSVEEQAGGVDGRPGGDLAEVVKPIEGRAIRGLSYFELLPEF